MRKHQTNSQTFNLATAKPWQRIFFDTSSAFWQHMYMHFENLANRLMYSWQDWQYHAHTGMIMLAVNSTSPCRILDSAWLWNYTRSCIAFWKHQEEPFLVWQFAAIGLCSFVIDLNALSDLFSHWIMCTLIVAKLRSHNYFSKRCMMTYKMNTFMQVFWSEWKMSGGNAGVSYHQRLWQNSSPVQ